MKKNLSLRTVIPAILLCIASGCYPSRTLETEREIKILYVDSVWRKGPGEINTMQIDPVYFSRTSDGRIHRTRKKIKIGDPFICISEGNR